MKLKKRQNGGNNPIIFIDPDGNADVIFVRNSNPKNKKFQWVAMVYQDNAIDNVKLVKLVARIFFKQKYYGLPLTEKDDITICVKNKMIEE